MREIENRLGAEYIYIYMFALAKLVSSFAKLITFKSVLFVNNITKVYLFIDFFVIFVLLKKKNP